MSLSINITLDKPPGPWYTNHDLVSGQVKLSLKSSTEVTKVTVSLLGTSITHLTRVDDVGQKFTDRVEERCVVLSMQHQLFPPINEEFGSSYCLRSDEYAWPFEFVLPMESSGFERGALPPSLSDLDKDRGYIRYFLRAEVEYASNRLRLGSAAGSSCYSLPIIFLPTDSESLDALSTYGIIHTNKSSLVAKSKLIGLISRLRTTLAHDMLPTCSNVADITARMEFLLTPGMKFSWILEAKPIGQQEMTIVGIKFSLKAITHVRAKNVEETFENCDVLLENRQLNLHEGDLTAQLKHPVIIIPSSVPPTFSAPNLQREYRIEIKVYWNHPTSDLLHKAVLERMVFVRSGMQVLPNYETGEIVRPERDFPQQKWYNRI